jgi:hypothetical protein
MVPPAFGVWLMAGVLSAMTRPTRSANAAMARVRDMNFLHDEVLR